MKNGFYDISKEAEDVQVVSCSKIAGGNVTGRVNFDTCIDAGNSALSSHFDDSTTKFKVPETGFYALSFSAVLQSHHGSRIWIHLNMKDAQTGEDCVLGAAFSGLYTDDEQIDKADVLSLTTSTSLTALERLKKGDEIWVSIGRAEIGSAMIVRDEQPAVLTIKLVATNQA